MAASGGSRRVRAELTAAAFAPIVRLLVRRGEGLDDPYVNTDIETLITALYVKIDDELVTEHRSAAGAICRGGEGDHS